MKFPAVRSLVLLVSLVFTATAEADVFYRETFNFCEAPSARPSALSVAGWTAITTGKVLGKPTILKIQPVGAATRLAAVNSAPEGPEDGNGYWNRGSRGLHIYTREVSFDISTLTSVIWRQRIDRQDKAFPAYGARLAFLIGNQWYISDYSATQITRGVFERRELAPFSLTYGTVTDTPGVGIAAPLNSGVALPASGTVSAVGLFFWRNFSKVRIDDFALVNAAPAGTNRPDHTFELCPGSRPDPNDQLDQGEEVPPPPTQCADGIDNDGDNLVDMLDAGCATAAENSEAGGIPPHAPTDLQAADGTSDDHVRLTWAPISDAVLYRVFRSQFSQTTGDLIADSVATASYNDRSAVPGVTYYYSVTALNEFSDESVRSNIDPGHRYSGASDSDGDGVTNDQELGDGTDLNDPGSFQLHLKSPAFTKYNTFLGQWNFLELGASGSKVIHAKVSILSPDGTPISSTTVSIQPSTQLDLDVNALLRTGCAENPAACAGLADIDANGVVDTYGIVRIDFNDFSTDIGANLIGRMSNYLQNGNGGFSFTFARELRNPTNGITYAGANTYDPQQQGFVVANWLEINNLDSQARDFEFLIWSQNGELVKKQSVRVPPLGERDLPAGHDILDGNGGVRPGVYSVEVRPRDGATNYFATVARYSSNAQPGFVSDTFNFAFALDALAGKGSTQFAPISNLAANCYVQENWVEVVNVREIPVHATVVFRGRDGQPVGSGDVTLAPKSQFHFNASSLLPKNDSGVVEVSGSETGSLVVQSLVYFHDCSSNKLQTAYVIQARIAGQDVQQGSVNTYLGAEDELYILSASATPIDITASLKTFDSLATDVSATLSLGALSTSSFFLDANTSLGVLPDRYGALTLKSLHPRTFTAGVLRIRRNPDGTIDSVMPTVVQ